MSQERALQSLKAFLPKQPQIESLIRYCDLYPIEGSWRKWTDHLGNYFQVYNNKKIVSWEGNPEITEQIIVTDLHQFSSPQQISQLSNRAFIASENNEKWMIWFLGKDKRLRLVYLGDTSQNLPALTVGATTLLKIIDLLESSVNQKIDIFSLPEFFYFKGDKFWVVDWPEGQDYIPGIPL